MHTIEEWMCAKDSLRTYIGYIGSDWIPVHCGITIWALSNRAYEYTAWTANSNTHTHILTCFGSSSCRIHVRMQCNMYSMCAWSVTSAAVRTVNVLVVTGHENTTSVLHRSWKNWVLGQLRVWGWGMERRCAAEMGCSGQILLTCGLSYTHD